MEDREKEVEMRAFRCLLRGWRRRRVGGGGIVGNGGPFGHFRSVSEYCMLRSFSEWRGKRGRELGALIAQCADCNAG